MQHYIQRLIISNFKSCQSLNITLTPLSLLLDIIMQGNPTSYQH